MPANPLYGGKQAYAASSGTVYSCTVVPCYRHPVTGVIEDSGGEASYTTGQGMVEGALYPYGILEVTDAGAYYLTIKMSLVDYCSGHSFQVQSVGDSGWTTPSEMGVTQQGSDTNGTTYDICMRVPSENCIVRGTMYVEPMGRNVVFYCYPTNFSVGNTTDMVATMVDASAAAQGDAQVTDAQAATADTSSSTATDASSGTAADTSSSTAIDAQAAVPDTSADASTLDSGSLGDTGVSSTDAGTGSSAVTLDNNDLSGLAAAAAEEAEASLEESGLSSAQGLSLSTAVDAEEDDEDGSYLGVYAAKYAIKALFTVLTGVILLLCVAGIGYVFLRNWKRWLGGDDDYDTADSVFADVAFNQDAASFSDDVGTDVSINPGGTNGTGGASAADADESSHEGGELR